MMSIMWICAKEEKDKLPRISVFCDYVAQTLLYESAEFP